MIVPLLRGGRAVIGPIRRDPRVAAAAMLSQDRRDLPPLAGFCIRRSRGTERFLCGGPPVVPRRPFP
jgi:hypothetical protein